ncbi:MAG: sigma-70 family RNA polymerase sigma factor [Planctomycetia bacterium]|nr:sigma-70 family RNA polymerase sigma factor [Planctomycetia bacterium]
MHTDYRSPEIREFRDQQLRLASRREQLDFADRAERLLDQVDPRRSYPQNALLTQIAANPTISIPSAPSASAKLSGSDVSHDLRLLVEDVSGAANLPIEAAGERVLTVDELSRQFHVSTKTISRWRQQGLVGRRFVVDGRQRVGFLQSSVDRFVHGNQERVRRGSRFRQMTDSERREIVETARRMATAGCGPAEVARQLGRQMDRSVETIRCQIKQHDRAHPGEAIFPDSAGPLTDELRTKIYQQYRRGEPVEALAKRHGRTKTTIYRVVSEMRAQWILALPLDFVPNDQFPRVRNEEVVLGPAPEANPPQRKPRAPSGLPTYLASLYEVPLLTREQEGHLFRRFNYAKYRASRLREKLDPQRPQRELMAEIERLYEVAVSTKNQIVRANLRLVVSIAKRHVGSHENFFELVSDGNMSLIRAAEKFDFARGNKFSTYASWAIMKNYARTIPDELKYRDRYRTSHDEMFGATQEYRSDWYEQESAQSQRKSEVEKIMRRLDDREQKIIMHRFGLDHAQEPRTLKEVGAALGVTKERVRQIEARALSKLRQAVAEEKIDLPDEE